MAEGEGKLRVCVLVGSIRAGSNTARVAGLVGAGLAAAGAELDLVDPRALDLRVPGAEDAAAANDALARDLRARVAASGLVVLATPEYDGSYSAVLKILIEHLGYPSALNGKAVALVGVAAGAIGAVKALEHLRGLCVHVGALVMPEAQSLAAAHKSFDAAGRCTDPALVQASAAFGRAAARFARWTGPRV